MTRCFSRIKDKTSFDSKFKDSPWRSRTSGNLNWVGRNTTHDIIKQVNHSLGQFMLRILSFCVHDNKLQIADACGVIFSL